MSDEVSSNEWGRVLHHADRGVLELAWRDAPISDNGFMATLALLALEAERVRPTAIVVDARTFRHTFGPGVMDWRNAAILPRYGAAGVRHFAFVVPAGSPAIGRETVEGQAVFPTAWFDSHASALDWIGRGRAS
jgi:hypothetical protein